MDDSMRKLALFANAFTKAMTEMAEVDSQPVVEVPSGNLVDLTPPPPADTANSQNQGSTSQVEQRHKPESKKIQQKSRFVASSSSASVTRRATRGAAARLLDQPRVELGWDQSWDWEKLDDTPPIVIGPWNSPTGRSGRASPDIISRESASGLDTMEKDKVPETTSQEATLEGGDASETDNEDSGDEKEHTDNEQAKRNRLPDLVRVVQRTGGDIPECLFEAEERWQRSLVDQYGYNLAPLRNGPLLDVDDDEEKQKQLLAFKKEVLEKLINQEQVAAGDEESKTSLLSDGEDMEVFKHISLVVDEDYLHLHRQRKRKFDEVDHSGDDIAEEAINTNEKPSKIQRRHFYPATNDEILSAESACEKLVQSNRAKERPKQAEIWKKVYELAKDNKIEDDSPFRNYLSDEWAEKPYIREYLRRRLKSVQVKVVPSDLYSMKAALIKRPKLDKNPSIPEHLITTSIHVKDSDGESLFLKISTGAEEVFGSDRLRIDEHIMDAMNRLKDRGIDPPINACVRYPLLGGVAGGDDPVGDPDYVPPDDDDDTDDSDIEIEIESDDDMRIESENEEEAAAGPGSKKKTRYILRRTKRIQTPKQFWNKKGEPSGVFHFALWGMQGRKKDVWAPTAPWNQMLSSDVFGKGPAEYGFRLRFLSDLAPVQQIMSLWFETIDTKQYKEYRSHVDLMCAEDTGMKAIRFSQNHSFLGIAAIRNLEAHNHRDSGDVLDGWVGMTCCGRFGGGELCLPELGFRCTFLPGDIVFFRSALLQHFVQAAIGKRSSLVFFSHSGVRQIQQNARFMTNNDEYEAALNTKLDGFKKREERENKRRAYQDLSPYPTLERDLTPPQMKRATARKNRFIKHAVAKFNEGTLTKEVVERVKRTPVPLFYELNLIELARHAKGEYPFKGKKTSGS